MNEDNTNHTENQLNQIETPTESNPDKSIEDYEKHKKKARKIALFVVLGIIFVPIILWGLLLMSLSGGPVVIIKEFFGPPDPNSQNLVEEKNKIKSEIVSEFEQIKSVAYLKDYDTAYYDACANGQNNYKVQDGYVYKCIFRHTTYFGSDNFPSSLKLLEEHLQSSDWKLPSWSTESDPLQKEAKRAFKFIEIKDGDEIYEQSRLVSQLVTSPDWYYKDSFIFNVEYAERETTDLFGIDYAQKHGFDLSFNFYEKPALINTEQVFKKITANHKYLFAISLQGTYFEN